MGVESEGGRTRSGAYKTDVGGVMGRDTAWKKVTVKRMERRWLSPSKFEHSVKRTVKLCSIEQRTLNVNMEVQTQGGPGDGQARWWAETLCELTVHRHRIMPQSNSENCDSRTSKTRNCVHQNGT